MKEKAKPGLRGQDRRDWQGPDPESLVREEERRTTLFSSSQKGCCGKHNLG